MEHTLVKERKIKNKNYLMFLEKGEIVLLEQDALDTILKSIKGKYKDEGRALIILLYLTGVRPAEALECIGKDIQKEDKTIAVYINGGIKRSKPRIIRVRASNRFAKELLTFSKTLPELAFLFYHFRGNYTRKHTNKKGVTKQYKESTARLRYWFKKWTKNLHIGTITPYYLRHNRISSLSSKGASAQEMMFIKGTTRYESVLPYLHLSKEKSIKISKLIK